MSGSVRADYPKLPEPQPHPLRLDESPTLPLLEGFRYARGRPGSFYIRYLDGPYSTWRMQPWDALAWTRPSSDEMIPHPASGLSDIASLRERRSEPWLGLGVEPPPAHRWPFVDAGQHWFLSRPREPALLGSSPGPGAPAQSLSLRLSEELLPKWLRRLDDSWAYHFLARFGCGRGGHCSPHVSFPAAASDQLWDALTPKSLPVPTWQCWPRPVTIRRFGRESDSFVLVRCDGSVEPDAMDRLSLLARPVGTDRPAVPLPDEPDATATRGEWIQDVRLIHPRLLWVLDTVAREHPWRPIYLYSGYRRPHAHSNAKRSTHYSRHWLGEALDISVHDVPNEELFALCLDLPDVGCGFYPHQRFVHIDVRRRGTGTVHWIDASEHGEPPRYVDSWPGVVVPP